MVCRICRRETKANPAPGISRCNEGDKNHSNARNIIYCDTGLCNVHHKRADVYSSEKNLRGLDRMDKRIN